MNIYQNRTELCEMTFCFSSRAYSCEFSLATSSRCLELDYILYVDDKQPKKVQTMFMEVYGPKHVEPPELSFVLAAAVNRHEFSNLRKIIIGANTKNKIIQRMTDLAKDLDAKLNEGYGEIQNCELLYWAYRSEDDNTGTDVTVAQWHLASRDAVEMLGMSCNTILILQALCSHDFMVLQGQQLHALLVLTIHPRLNQVH